MDTRSALRTALVRGSAFTLVTAAYLLIGGTLGGYLWCVYVGFFLTMAFGAKGEDLPRYLCSFLAGYVWAAVYVYLPELLGGLMPGAAATVVSEFVVTAGLLFCTCASSPAPGWARYPRCSPPWPRSLPPAGCKTPRPRPSPAASAYSWPAARAG